MPGSKSYCIPKASGYSSHWSTQYGRYNRIAYEFESVDI